VPHERSGPRPGLPLPRPAPARGRWADERPPEVIRPLPDTPPPPRKRDRHCTRAPTRATRNRSCRGARGADRRRDRVLMSVGQMYMSFERRTGLRGSQDHLVRAVVLAWSVPCAQAGGPLGQPLDPGNNCMQSTVGARGFFHMCHPSAVPFAADADARPRARHVPWWLVAAFTLRPDPWGCSWGSVKRVLITTGSCRFRAHGGGGHVRQSCTPRRRALKKAVCAVVRAGPPGDFRRADDS